MRKYQLISAGPAHGSLEAGPATEPPFDLPIIIPPLFPLFIEKTFQEYHLNDWGARVLQTAKLPVLHLPPFVEKMPGKAPFGNDNSG
jgi:hypothetical protein